MTGSAPNNQEMALTLAEAMKTLATSRHRLLWDANPPVGDPCWGLWHGFEFVGPFDSWPEAASFALGVRVVERDEAAELRAQNAELVEALGAMLRLVRLLYGNLHLLKGNEGTAGLAWEEDRPDIQAAEAVLARVRGDKT